MAETRKINDDDIKFVLLLREYLKLLIPSDLVEDIKKEDSYDMPKEVSHRLVEVFDNQSPANLLFLGKDTIISRAWNCSFRSCWIYEVIKTL